MKRRKFFRKLYSLLYNRKLLGLSFIIILVLDFLTPKLPNKEIFENLQLILAVYFAFGLSFLLLEKTKKLRRLDRYSIFLIQAFLTPAFIVIILWPHLERLPESIETLLILVLMSSAATILIFLLRFLFFILKKFSFLFRFPKFRKVLAIAVVSALLIAFGQHYFLLQKRVTKLEKIAGPKKILCDEKESIKKVKESLVRIIGVDAEGSGFFVTSSGFIATNHHVIAYDPNPKIVLPNYSLVQGEVTMADKTSDLALIKVRGQENLPAVTFADSNQIEPMEELVSIGYPYGLALRGEPSAVKGRFVALRPVEEMEVNLVQTDMSLNPGASGGPMINICGEVVAINASGVAGLGMGISSNDFQRKWDEMILAEEPLKDVKKITFNPNGSPKECVEAFYNYQTIGKLEEAYNLLSKDYIHSSFEEWREGYKNTLNVLLYETMEIEGEENKVYVKFSSADLEGEKIVYRFFEGILEVKEIDGELKLDKHEIGEIVKPEWDWFFSLPDWLKP